MFFVISFQAFSDHSSECYVTIFHEESLKNRNLKLKISTLALSCDSKIAWIFGSVLTEKLVPTMIAGNASDNWKKKCLGDEDVST